MSKSIHITIAYALPQQQWVQELEIMAGSQVADVLAYCKTLPFFANLDLNKLAIGIFGKEVSLNQKMQEGDRLEIYRPLICDAKTARRKRAENTKKK